MVLPSIAQDDRTTGFHWRSPDGRPVRLQELVVAAAAEPKRWLPTHLEALDDVLVAVTGRFGDVLGGARSPHDSEREPLRAAYRAIDRACAEYAAAAAAASHPHDLRAGQIVGTGALVSVRARAQLGWTGPTPLEGTLDVPGPGVVGGHARLRWADEARPWQGARWVIEATDGRVLPATLSMLLFDSSGVLKDAALDEHRDALTRTTAAVVADAVEPIRASGAVDWLLFDWLMAHRDGPDSGAVEIRPGRLDDATMIVTAAATSARSRALFDLGLLDLPD